MWEDTSHTASLAQSEMARARGSHLGNTLVRDIIARATLVLIMRVPTRGIAAHRIRVQITHGRGSCDCGEGRCHRKDFFPKDVVTSTRGSLDALTLANNLAARHLQLLTVCRSAAIFYSRRIEPTQRAVKNHSFIAWLRISRPFGGGR